MFASTVCAMPTSLAGRSELIVAPDLENIVGMPWLNTTTSACNIQWQLEYGEQDSSWGAAGKSQTEQVFSGWPNELTYRR
jgi:hypothetical protein